MPFTPFHLGPALLAKSIAPRWFSFSAFALSQVAIDCETLYWRARHEWYVHRGLHTFAGGAIAGGVLAVIWSALVLPQLRRLPVLRRLGSSDAVMAEARLWPAIVGGLVGGLSHALLDGIVHWDMRPLRPLTAQNPLFGLVDESVVYLFCAATGALGLGLGVLLRDRQGRGNR